MNIDCIEIGNPYIVLEHGFAKLESEIKYFEQGSCIKSQSLFYKVPAKYEPYLCTERIDAFLVALIPKAMQLSAEIQGNLVVKSSGSISEKLYYQLTSAYFPTLAASISSLAAFEIACETDNTVLPTENAVGTGVSGGVDSFYTILSHLDGLAHYKVTHGVYGNYMLYGDLDSVAEENQQKNSKAICEEVGIEYLCVETNTCKELYDRAYAPIVSCLFSALPLALQKLFHVYYFSSSIPFAEFIITETNSTLYDLLNVYCLSNENVSLYSTGSETSRIEKTRYISNYPVSYDHLKVCLRPNEKAENCGKCSKCTRTMIQLETLGKLDLYKHSFDTDAFYDDLNYHYGYFVYMAGKDLFYKETCAEMKKQNKKLPRGAYLAAVEKWIKLHRKK